MIRLRINAMQHDLDIDLELITGVGELATPEIMPVVANVLFAATGKRFHHLLLKLTA